MYTHTRRAKCDAMRRDDDDVVQYRSHWRTTTEVEDFLASCAHSENENKEKCPSIVRVSATRCGFSYFYATCVIPSHLSFSLFSSHSLCPDAPYL